MAKRTRKGTTRLNRANRRITVGTGEQVVGKPVQDAKHTELIVGLVGPAGASLERVSEVFTDALGRVRYSLKDIRLSELLHAVPKPPWRRLRDAPLDVRYHDHMDAGNKLRERLKDKAALAVLAIGAVRDLRTDETRSATSPANRTAYLLRSLKTPEEVKLLQHVYGWRFVLVAAYTPRENRVCALARRIAESHHDFDMGTFRKEAETILERDESELLENDFGQNVRETFPLADLFVNTSDPDELRSSINRATEIFFGHPFHTPSSEEYGMFHARAAALRSASMGRQVGAAIATTDGDIVVTGCNEVPKAGGGQYWCDETPDHRDHVLGYDSSDTLKRRLLADVLHRLRKNKWLARKKTLKDVDELVEQVIAGKANALMKGTQIKNILEFGRPVHAEMAALTSAARRGIAVNGCILYTTTFPCHECARHIVAAGIRKVVYVEPYPKSLVPELHSDSNSVDGPADSERVAFVPFVGIAPKQYFSAFSSSKDARKHKDGTAKKWTATSAFPRAMLRTPTTNYLTRESVETLRIKATMEREGLS